MVRKILCVEVTEQRARDHAAMARSTGRHRGVRVLERTVQADGCKLPVWVVTAAVMEAAHGL